MAHRDSAAHGARFAARSGSELHGSLLPVGPGDEEKERKRGDPLVTSRRLADYIRRAECSKLSRDSTQNVVIVISTHVHV